MLDFSLGCTEDIASDGINRHEERVTDQREVMIMFLRYREPVVKFHKPSVDMSTSRYRTKCNLVEQIDVKICRQISSSLERRPDEWTKK
ncbi:hypothetical protein Pgy4_42454 [Pseudomonas savastanoi pv. glycinea str. race 4]|uniref:Uncharacterized protein n=1 Tax=Pseudomonas savastanoi pv. glycinea str. race 4 TaxID=875330 RepID=F3CK54_PSESG|nr:hypothetical protein Pgy4_42454 [Pseudomonas savastanoi pv. glycinea str. race 4]